MKIVPFVVVAASLLGMAKMPSAQAAPTKAPQVASSLRGEVYFLERIALPPNARLHLSLVGHVQGASYLPISSVVIPARNGITPFSIPLPPANLRPAPPYRLQAWIIAENRVFMIGHQPKTTITDLNKPVRMRLKIASSGSSGGSMNEDEEAPQPDISETATGGENGNIGLPAFYPLNGTVTKLDRRALSSDARVVVTLSDVSRADAPAVILGRRTIELKGQQLPVKWEFGVSLNKIRPNGRYALRAQVYESGKLTYTTENFIGVTPENAGDEREILVRSASAPS